MKQTETSKNPSFSCEKCLYITNIKKDFNKHLMTSKHKSVTTEPPTFSCEKCRYVTNHKNDYDRHLLTAKHTSVTEKPISPKFLPIESFHVCKKCNTNFTNRTSLWRHKKTCIYNPDDGQPNVSDIKTLTTLVLDVVKSNTDLQKQNQELQKQMIDMCKNGASTINNTINSHNKTFNLNFFLNEQCKDAMNIMDFVDSLQLQMSDLENVGRLGFINGISDIIIKNLKALDIHKRPVHCTDLKREVMYVKDDNQWNKETEDNIKIRRAIKCIAQKNTKNLVLFKQKHSDCLQGDSRSSDQYNKLVREAFGGGSDKDDTASENKIISRLSREVAIDKSHEQ